MVNLGLVFYFIFFRKMIYLKLGVNRLFNIYLVIPQFCIYFKYRIIKLHGIIQIHGTILVIDLFF